MNYNRLHNFDNYDKIIAMQENYGELIIEYSHFEYKLYIDRTNYHYCKIAVEIECFFMKAYNMTA